MVPGGTAPGVGLSYRLLSQSGVRTADAGFGLAMQGVGSAVVLNVLFWLALIVSLFTNGFHPLYTYAAAAGTLLMGSFAAVIVALTKGRRRSIEVVRQWADHVPFLDGDRLAEGVQRVADRLRIWPTTGSCCAGPSCGRRPTGFSTPRVCWSSSSPSHGYVSPINLLVAYGLANILAVIPITPGGLGIIEGILIPALHGFGVPLVRGRPGRPRLPGGEFLVAHSRRGHQLSLTAVRIPRLAPALDRGPRGDSASIRHNRRSTGSQPARAEGRVVRSTVPVRGHRRLDVPISPTPQHEPTTSTEPKRNESTSRAGPPVSPGDAAAG